MIRHVELLVHAGFDEGNRSRMSFDDRTPHQFREYFSAVDRVALRSDRVLVMAHFPGDSMVNMHPQVPILVDYARRKLGKRFVLYVDQVGSNIPSRLDALGGFDPRTVRVHGYGELANACVSDQLARLVGLMKIPTAQAVLRLDRSSGGTSYHPGLFKNISKKSDIADPEILFDLESLRSQGFNVGIGNRVYPAHRADYKLW